MKPKDTLIMDSRYFANKQCVLLIDTHNIYRLLVLCFSVHCCSHTHNHNKRTI